MNIIDLIADYKDAFCDYVISGKRYKETKEAYDKIKFHIQAMQEVINLASELLITVNTVHLDMGGGNLYSLNIKSHPIIFKLKKAIQELRDIK